MKSRVEQARDLAEEVAVHFLTTAAVDRPRKQAITSWICFDASVAVRAFHWPATAALTRWFRRRDVAVASPPENKNILLLSGMPAKGKKNMTAAALLSVLYQPSRYHFGRNGCC